MADITELIFSKAAELVTIAGFENITIGFAESLTGGLISSSVVAVPGASAVFKGSVVSYTNEVKEGVLGVPSGIISAYTEVSAECDLAISVTGIAGPTGELPGKPVGTVYMGYCFRDIAGSLRLNFNGDRDTIRTCTVLEALNKAISLIKDGKA